jgi:hypothetical protein
MGITGSMFSIIELKVMIFTMNGSSHFQPAEPPDRIKPGVERDSA